MCYDVTCSVCDLSHVIDDLDAVFDLQEEHQRRHGDHHVLEFERLAASDGGEDDRDEDDGRDDGGEG